MYKERTHTITLIQLAIQTEMYRTYYSLALLQFVKLEREVSHEGCFLFSVRLRIWMQDETAEDLEHRRQLYDLFRQCEPTARTTGFLTTFTGVISLAIV